MKVLFYDLETTGFRPCGIMQISMIGIDTDDENQDFEFTSFVNPGDEQIHPQVPHNLTLEDVRDAPAFEQISDDLMEFIDGSILVGFNNHTFDDCVLQDAYGIDDINEFISSSYDILPLVKGISQNRALQENGLMNPRPHDAEYDVRSLIALVERLGVMEELPEECTVAARLLVQLLDFDQFQIPTSDEISGYEDEFLDDDGYITLGIYAGRTLEDVRVEDPWFADFISQRMA